MLRLPRIVTAGLAAFSLVGLWGGLWQAPALAKASQAKLERAFTIVPGRAIGEVALGQDRSVVEGLLGQPDNVQQLAPDYVLETWGARGYVVGFRGEDGPAVVVTVTDPHFRTANGVHVGLPLSVVERAYPDGSEPQLANAPSGAQRLVGWQDLADGITFMQDPGHAGKPEVDQITVFTSNP